MPFDLTHDFPVGYLGYCHHFSEYSNHTKQTWVDESLKLSSKSWGCFLYAAFIWSRQDISVEQCQLDVGVEIRCLCLQILDRKVKVLEFWRLNEVYQYPSSCCMQGGRPSSESNDHPLLPVTEKDFKFSGLTNEWK